MTTTYAAAGLARRRLPVGCPRPGRRSSSSTPPGSTGWPTGSPATCTTPRTSPRTSSSGCSARCTPTSPAPSRAGCTASPPTSSSTRCAASSGSASTRSPTSPPPGCPAAAPGPEQRYDDAHFDDDVQRALDALPPDFRAAVVLCDIEGLSYEEIAATLGIKLGTVRSRIHRGRAQLREALAHRAPQPSTTTTPTKSRGRHDPSPGRRRRMTDAMRVQCQGDELTEYAAGRLPAGPPVGVGPPPRRLPGLRPRRRPGAPAAQCAAPVPRRCRVTCARRLLALGAALATDLGPRPGGRRPRPAGRCCTPRPPLPPQRAAGHRRGRGCRGAVRRRRVEPHRRPSGRRAPRARHRHGPGRRRPPRPRPAPRPHPCRSAQVRLTQTVVVGRVGERAESTP